MKTKNTKYKLFRPNTRYTDQTQGTQTKYKVHRPMESKKDHKTLITPNTTYRDQWKIKRPIQGKKTKYKLIWSNTRYTNQWKIKRPNTS